MVILLKKMFKGYFWIFNEQADHRTDDFFWVTSPLYPLLVGITYIVLVFKLLPHFMKNRPPYKLNAIIIVFNLLQVVANAYIFYQGCIVTSKLDWSCAPVNYSSEPDNMFIVKSTHFYYLLKISDLFDTIFFVLRGKYMQVSFLHVYHHLGMVFASWIGVRFYAGGHNIFVGVVNCFVHMLMYFYYFLTVWKPEFKKHIWWKKHITHLQLIQFGFLGLMFAQVVLNPNCTFPKFMSFLFVIQNMFMIILFGDFYWRAYIRPKKIADKK